MSIVARHHRTGLWVRIKLDGPKIASVEPADGPSPVEPGDDWVAPAFWDIQMNGRWGVSFSDGTLTVEQVVAIVRAQDHLGTAKVCPTLITASRESTIHGLKTIAAACESVPAVAARVAGIHLEGPYISEVDGYRGAHPLPHVRNPDLDEWRAFQDAAGGRVNIMTLAPERPGSIPFIETLVSEGVVVALAHTAANPTTLKQAARAGAKLSTHLGNGIVATLPRHPNPIWIQASLDELSASFIADGHHLDGDSLKVLARAKGQDRVILVSDASPLAGLPPGKYGDWAVDPSGKIVVAGTTYLAGSNQGLETGVNLLQRATGWPIGDVLATTSAHPARLLGQPQPELSAGQPANLIRFRLDPTLVVEGKEPFHLRSTCVQGDWTEAGAGEVSPWALSGPR